jgi:AcrR family transcriptional regulator
VSSESIPRRRYDDLVEIATELFSEYGYERTTVRMIAERMGIKSGTLYSHISGKDEVLERIVNTVGEDFITRLVAAVEQSDDPVERLRAMCRSHLAVLHDHLEAVTVYFNEWQKLQPDARTVIVDIRIRYETLLREVINDGIARGVFSARNPDDVVLMLLSGLNWTYKWYRPGGGRTPDEIADGLLQVVLDGLLARDTPTPAV